MAALPAPGSVRDLRERCEALRHSIEVHDLASKDEVASYWPGGAENPHRDRWGWTFAFANMVRFRSRAEQLPSVRGFHDRVVLATLAEEPESVTLTNGAVVAVHPKSLHTLLYITVHDRLLDWLNGRLYVLQQTGNVDDIGLIERTLKLIYRHQSILAWIAVTPGRGMPFDADVDTPNELPAEFKEWCPEDHVRVLRTFLKVHYGRFESLKLSLAPPSGSTGERALSWSRWFAAFGIETKVDPTSLIRDQSFVKLLTMAQLGAADASDRDRERQQKAKR